jgi:hypothetical protein
MSRNQHQRGEDRFNQRVLRFHVFEVPDGFRPVFARL